MAVSNRLRGSTDFANAAYWSLGALAAGNDLRISEGADGFDTNVNQAGIDFASVYFDQQYGDQSTVLGPTAPLKFDVDRTNTGIFKFNGRCATLNLAAGTVTGKIWELNWLPLNPNARLNLTAVTLATKIFADNGTIDIAGDVIFTTGEFAGGASYIRYNATAATLLQFNSGTHYVYRSWTNMEINGDAIVYVDTDTVAGGAVAINGKTAQLIHLSGNMGALDIKTGTYDKSQLKKAATITSNTWHGAKGVEKLERGSAVVTMGTTTDRGRAHVKVS